MSTATATSIFQTELAASGGKAPDWVEVFPAGPDINARDGRKWTLDPKTVISAFKANNGPLPIDYEHAQAHKAPKGELAPAAGWITELEERAGAIWGKVEWVAAAAKMIVEKAYRFLSPEFHTDSNNAILSLAGAGLVNRPALEMTALSREENQQENEEMSLKAIAKALGLADDANEAAILAALAQRDTERGAGHTALCQALKLDAKSDGTSIIAAVAKLQDTTALAAQAAPELAKLQTEIAALKAVNAESEINGLLDNAAKEGKITPASRDTYKGICMAEGGIARFKALAATLPVICAPSGLDDVKVTARDPDNADPVALAAKARKYQDEQAAVGRAISFDIAVMETQEQMK